VDFFFEHQQRGRLGERALFPGQLALELLDALGLGRPRGFRVERLLGGLPPCGQVGRLQPFAAQQRPQRGLIHGRGLLHDTELLRAGPS
jgi:hypothetical protein